MLVPFHISNLPFISHGHGLSSSFYILFLLTFHVSIFTHVTRLIRFSRHADACFAWTFIWKWSVSCLPPFCRFRRVFFWCSGMVFWKIVVLCFYIWISILSLKVVRRFFFLGLGSEIEMSLLCESVSPSIYRSSSTLPLRGWEVWKLIDTYRGITPGTAYTFKECLTNGEEFLDLVAPAWRNRWADGLRAFHGYIFSTFSSLPRHSSQAHVMLTMACHWGLIQHQL
jgi:hypothetical protein